MSAEQLGRRLLQEVEEGSFDEILAEIRSSVAELHTSTLGIPVFDQIFDIFRKPQQPPSRPAWISSQITQEDEDQFYDESFTTFTPTSLEPRPMSTHKPNVIQLTSSRSASGKTHLLYHLAAISALPRACQGNEATVVWLDTDGRFSPLRLAEVVTHLLHTGGRGQDSTDQVKAALGHVHLFHLQSSAQLIETLKALPEYLLSRDRHHSQQRCLGLLILDSATAFHWQDRGDAELARLINPGDIASPSTTTQIIAELKKLENLFECAVLLTSDSTLQRRPGLRQGGGLGSLAHDNDHQQRHDQWTNYATLTMHVQRVPVPQFAPAMTIEECERDQPNRLQAVRRGRHRAQILWTGNETTEIKDAVKSLQIGEGFNFRITSQGVSIE